MDVRPCRTLGCGATFDATAPRDDEVRWCAGTGGVHRHGQQWRDGTWVRLDGTEANGGARALRHAT